MGNRHAGFIARFFIQLPLSECNHLGESRLGATLCGTWGCGVLFQIKPPASKPRTAPRILAKHCPWVLGARARLLCHNYRMTEHVFEGSCDSHHYLCLSYRGFDGADIESAHVLL